MNTNDVNDISTGNDDVSNTGQTEQQLLDAVLANSQFIEQEVPLPIEESSEVDPVESVEVEDPETEEVVSEEVEEEVEETDEDIESADDTSTQPDLYTTEDLDLEAQVSVKINGEDTNVSFGDLIKGYSTEQSLSKKGRELGEARKQFEDQKQTDLAAVHNDALAVAEILNAQEKISATEYHNLEAQIETARKDGDTFQVGELKDQREQVQKKYWNSRQQREGLQAQIAARTKSVADAEVNAQMGYFKENINNHIPNFTPEIGAQIRDFVIAEGIPASLVSTITSPEVVGLAHKYMQLKNATGKGAAKRKVVPAKKAVIGKSAPASKKKAEADKMVKARAFKEGASDDDQMDFLRQYASKSLNL